MNFNINDDREPQNKQTIDNFIIFSPKLLLLYE